MATKKKSLQAAAGSASGGEPVYIDSLFSTYLYTGNGSTQTITNGIDLDGEGGLVWIKARNNTSAANHHLFDTERGATEYLASNTTGAESTFVNTLTSFNADGFSLGTDRYVNGTGSSSPYASDFASWTFRKAPGFFDVVTYTGVDQGTPRRISHNLGCEPGMIIVKRTDDTSDWYVWHKSLSSNTHDRYLKLQDTGAESYSADFWGTSDPTSTDFGVKTFNNITGGTYVAYLFADGDDAAAQIFGTDGDQAVVKCGSYIGNGSNDGPEIDLGFEPQWLIVKKVNGIGDWKMYDSMRGLTSSSSSDYFLEPNTSDIEDLGNYYQINPNGFKLTDNTSFHNGSGDTYIYIAIRRPHKPAESGTEVFALSEAVDGPPTYAAPFPVDMAWRKNITVSNANLFGSRLTGINTLASDSTAAESTNAGYQWDFMDGWASDGGATSAKISWMFKRSPGFFDVVCYTGNNGIGTQTIDHNLGAAPELGIFKARDAADNWRVYHKDTSSNLLVLNSTSAASGDPVLSSPTSTDFVAEGGINGSGNDYIGYLFASQAGISKVGSYTGTQADNHVIDCGFTTGARFVLIKKSGSTGDWYLWDSERGITSTSNDPYLKLNSTVAEATESSGLGADAIQPHASGFQLMADTTLNGAIGYIYLAIA